MAYFPAFIDMSQAKVLIVGGGNIAFEKLEKVLDFTSEIHVIASELSAVMLKRIEQEGLSFECRAYKYDDVKSFDMVIIAVDDIELQGRVYQESRQYRCLCNAVDSVAYCDFIFPSYVKEDELTIAVSTSGASPAFAKYFKQYLKGLIPKDVSVFLKQMRSLRKSLPKGKERMKMLDERAYEYVKRFEEKKDD